LYAVWVNVCSHKLQFTIAAGAGACLHIPLLQFTLLPIRVAVVANVGVQHTQDRHQLSPSQPPPVSVEQTFLITNITLGLFGRAAPALFSKSFVSVEQWLQAAPLLWSRCLDQKQHDESMITLSVGQRPFCWAEVSVSVEQTLQAAPVEQKVLTTGITL
jgi:hypothetical protein